MVQELTRTYLSSEFKNLEKVIEFIDHIAMKLNVRLL